LKARKANLEPSGPLVIGYDPNWKGKDRASMAWRRGRKVLKVESRQGLDTMGQVGWLKQIIDTKALPTWRRTESTWSKWPGGRTRFAELKDPFAVVIEREP
jgi:hypothetical protein